MPNIFNGKCPTMKYYSTTICLDPAYSNKNQNAYLKALEVGGWNSRCFTSDLRQRGIASNEINVRCYTMTCSSDRRTLFIQVGMAILTCKTPRQVIRAPYTLTGTLTCPSNFDNYCGTKQTCINNCNINGVCINGRCLCTGSTKYTDGCLPVELTVEQVGRTGGLMRSVMVASTLNVSNTPGASANSVPCFENFVLQQ